jgi:hypothetical protein
MRSSGPGPAVSQIKSDLKTDNAIKRDDKLKNIHRLREYFPLPRRLLLNSQVNTSASARQAGGPAKKERSKKKQKIIGFPGYFHLFISYRRTQSFYIMAFSFYLNS